MQASEIPSGVTPAPHPHPAPLPAACVRPPNSWGGSGFSPSSLTAAEGRPGVCPTDVRVPAAGHSRDPEGRVPPGRGLSVLLSEA